MKKIRALLISQWYPPEPVSIPPSIADALSSREFDVAVLTGQPNYPDGRVQSGYRAWWRKRDSHAGIPLLRTPLVASHDRSALGRMANYLSWALSSAVLGLREIARADVVLVYSSPATAALGPWLWGRLVRTPYVILLQDLWPDSVLSSGMLPDRPPFTWLRRALSAFSTSTYRRAASVAVISPGMADVLESRGVDPDRIALVYNWSPREVPESDPQSRGAERSAFELREDDFVVTYAGNMGSAQGLDKVIEAAARLEDRPDVVFLMVGDGVDLDPLKQLAERLGASNVRFLGRVDASAMAVVDEVSDVQLVSLVDDPLFAVTMPSKVQAILAAGCPIISMAPGDAGAVAETSGAGWSVPPGDASSLVEAIETAADLAPEQLARRGRDGRDYYMREMSRGTGSARLSALLREASAGRPISTKGIE